MREILFRGKIFEKDQWVYGKLINGQGEKETYYILPEYETDFYAVKVEPETIGQYTGKVDADGKRIFEGDILKIMLYGKNLKVVWWKWLCGFGLNDKDENALLFMNEVHSNAVVVAGNIYDNPELMEE